MIVLAESNFVLDLAFRQEQSNEVESVVALAEAGRVELIIPACAFTESYQTLIRRLRERRQVINAVEQSFKPVGRPRGFRELIDASDEVLRTLTTIMSFSDARRIVERGIGAERSQVSGSGVG